jgi:hypothetical protein
LSEAALTTLAEYGLKQLVPEASAEMKATRDATQATSSAFEQDTMRKLEDKIRSEHAMLVAALSSEAAGTVVQKFS